MKLRTDVKKNIYYISAISVVLCALMLAVFLIAGYFSLKVLWGTLIGTFLALLNFFLLALTLNKAVDSEKRGKSIAALSYTSRTLMMFLIGILAIVILKVNPLALLLPYIFPRISISVLHVLKFRRGQGGK